MRRAVRIAVNFFIALAIALVFGLGGTWYALTFEKGVKTVTAGPWRAVIEIGTASANPYARAMLARTGAIPMLATESIVFRAFTDSRGAALRGACDYRLAGDRIDARRWTLTVTDDQGRLPAQDPALHATTSVAVVRDKDGRFEIALSPMARPGNWLATGGTARLALTLRLYDTPLYVNGGLDGITLPSITLERCP